VLVRYHRSELETVYDILTVCLKGANKHKIISKARLNQGNLTKFLDMLLNSGFLVISILYSMRHYQAINILYETTKAGENFREICLTILNKLGKFPSKSKIGTTITRIRG
jgi:predicted transcriptional regulator